MIKNLIGPLTVDQKINFIVIILALFISTFVEIISIGIVPVFLTALLVPEKIPNFINELIYVDQLFTLSEKNLILYGSIILLLIFIIKNIFLFILVFYEKNFLRKINISNASNLFKYFIESNLMFHLQRNSSELYSIISNVNEQYVEYIRCSILLVKESLIILSIFLILFYYQTNITLLIFGIFLIFTSIYFFIFRKILIKRGTIRQQFCDAQVKTMYESFGSIKNPKYLRLKIFL